MGEHMKLTRLQNTVIITASVLETMSESEAGALLRSRNASNIIRGGLPDEIYLSLDGVGSRGHVC